jgi:hypothetical protein
MENCPFRIGDKIVYTPSRRGHALIDGERPVVGHEYIVRNIVNGQFVEIEGYDHPGGGIHWSEFRLQDQADHN